MDHLARLAAAALAVVAGSHVPALAQQCCAPGVSTYCTAGTTVHGCVPSIGGVGAPSSQVSSGFDIVVSNVPGQRFGTIFYGFYAGAVPWAPFSPSFQCIAFPVQRTGDRQSGGTAGQCDGELRLDFNAWRAANPGALGSPYVAGQVIYAQGWFRDPGAPKQTNLSDGLRFVLDTCSSPAPGLVPISAGTFAMGSDAPAGPPYFGWSGERPVHQVSITRCYWMAQREVTQAQYAALMGTNPSYHQGADLPVDRVTWTQAMSFCAALTAQEAATGRVPVGYQYRLPTEAEWEYACRAGTTTEFSVGDELQCAQACVEYSDHTGLYCGIGGTVPVGSYSPNSLGLFDMHGNVWEWCLDSFSNYPANAVADPFVTGTATKVHRGGSYYNSSGSARSATRGQGGSTHAVINVGFRVVLAPILVP
jgi:formylglycine-generating enzyme required for sulfatase activity